MRRQSDRRNRARSPSRRALRAIVIGIVGAWVAVVLCGGVNGNLGIVSVRASLRPAVVGRTVLRIPPLGAVSARTHLGPALIDLSVDQVHIEETAEWMKLHKSPKQTAGIVEDGIRLAALSLARRAIVVATLGALAACLLLRVGGRNTIWGIAAGMLSVAIPLGLAAATYNPDAFENPTFAGEMSRAPQLLDTAQQAWQSNAEVIQDLPRIADRTAALCRKLGQGTLGAQPSDYRVLLISDLHNNPIAASFALDIANTYGADLVLVDGDFTDLGHPLEAQLLAGLKKFDVPLIGVTGNHDSRATVAALRGISRLTMLDDGRTVSERGLSVMGFGDPVSRRADMGGVNDSSAQLRSLTRRIGARLRRSQPDILMVHNNSVAKSFAGRAAVIVDGHSHNAGMITRDGSVIVNPGTTGAAGIRYFSAKERPAYTACVLHFTTGGHPRIRMVDSIRMEMPSGDFCVTRESVAAL